MGIAQSIAQAMVPKTVIAQLPIGLLFKCIIISDEGFR